MKLFRNPSVMLYRSCYLTSVKRGRILLKYTRLLKSKKKSVRNPAFYFISAEYIEFYENVG